MATIEQTHARLAALRSEIQTMAVQSPSIRSPNFTSWHSRTQSALTRLLGAEHHITKKFVGVHWTPMVLGDGDSSGALVTYFRQASEEVDGYLDAAMDELQASANDAGALDADGVDRELWEFVASDVAGEHWGKAATQATLFLEDRIRKWAGQPAELVGEKLMSAVFGPHGNLRLGRTDGEKDGWNLFAMGISKALRNAAAHRIETRPDHRGYVLGVIGACSLLLTQLRFEHGNRFDDLSPIEHEQ